MLSETEYQAQRAFYTAGLERLARSEPVGEQRHEGGSSGASGSRGAAGPLVGDPSAVVEARWPDRSEPRVEDEEDSRSVSVASECHVEVVEDSRSVREQRRSPGRSRSPVGDALPERGPRRRGTRGRKDPKHKRARAGWDAGGSFQY